MRRGRRETPPKYQVNESLIGQVLGGYLVEDVLGRGGMGVVYKAFDSDLQRRVAIKVMARSATSPMRRRRLLREARAASAVQHPGIVSIYQIGREGGVDFIVMELVPGEPLAQELARCGRLSVERALDFALQLVDAMDAAHGVGIVHRDLKPQNLMIDPQGQLRVLDFGIAKLEPMTEIATVEGEERLTDSGSSPGTLLYMAPEQILGEPVGAATDVFAVGLILFEMLSGRRPFQHQSVGDGSTDGLLRRLLFDDPPSLGELWPEAPVDLEAVVERCLQKVPEDRFETMGQLAEALRQIDGSARQVPLRSPPSAQGRSPSIGAMRWPRVGVAVGILAILCGLLAWGGGIGGRDERQREGPAAAIETLGEPVTAFDHWQQGEATLERYDRAGALDRAAESFTTALALQGDFAPAHSSLSRVHWRRYRRSRDPLWLQHALASARRAVELAPHLTEARVSLSLAWVEEGNWQAAQEELETLRDLDPQSADVRRGLAEVALRRGDLDQAIAHLQEAAVLRPTSWEHHAELGRAFEMAGRLEEAAAAFEASITVAADNAFALRNLAAVRHRQGRYGDAVDALQASLSVRPNAGAYSNLGTAYFFQGYFREAAEAFEAALELAPREALLWANFADALRQVPERSQEAPTAYRRAVQILDQALEDNPEELTLQSRRALFLARAGDLQRALSVMPDLPSIETSTAAAWFRLGVVHELAGQRTEALRALENALQAGYPLVEIRNEPDLVKLREDLGYQRLAMSYSGSPG